jgi:hypothetical protein
MSLRAAAEELSELINATRNKEHACRYYLQHTGFMLVPETVVRFNRVETERMGNLGRSDYIISATVWNGGEESVRAYIWELKAPQCYIFSTDVHNRLKPTKELIDAENKLLNFYYENKNNPLFHHQYGISHPASDNVKLGGIIIGCNRTKVNGTFTQTEKAQLFSVAKSARNLMYESCGIHLKTWDEVLHHINSNVTTGRRYNNAPTELPLATMPPDTESSVQPSNQT